MRTWAGAAKECKAVWLAAILLAGGHCTEEHGLAPGLHSFVVRLGAKPCSDETACGAHGQCLDGTCVCLNDAQCPTGWVCSDDNECVNGSTPAVPMDYVSGASCTTVGTCPGAEERCRRYCSGLGNDCVSDDDCGTGELCQGVCAQALHIDIKAIGRDCASADTDEAFARCPAYPYTGWVHLDATPGMVPPSDAYLQLQNGQLNDAAIHVARASGQSHLWVEVDGYVRRAAYYGQCNDNLDNDGNGWVDLADPGCRDNTDDCEGCERGAVPPTARSPLGATGLSADLWYVPPSVRNMQYTDSMVYSPLEGEDIRVDNGQMVVTNVTSTGLYLTDIRFQQDPLSDVHPTAGTPMEGFEPYFGQPGFYNSLFLYTWSTPSDVYQGDIVCWFSGGVVEYMGNTQVRFPNFFTYYPSSYECDDLRRELNMSSNSTRHEMLRRMGLLLEETDPLTDIKTQRLDLDKLTVDVTAKLVAEVELKTGRDGLSHWAEVSDYKNQVLANSQSLEPFESGMVRINDVQVATRFIECDANGSGEIDANTAEDVCRDDCQKDVLCTDLSSYAQYNQWAGLFAGKKKMYVNQEMLKENIPLHIQAVGQPDLDGRCTMSQVWIEDTRFYQYQCPPMNFASVRGNLRQIYLCTRDVKESCSLQLISLTPTGDDDVVPATGGK